MKKGWILLTAMAAFIALGFVPAKVHAQGSVAGVVVDADGEAVEGAVVVIHSMERGRWHRPFHARAETNEEGVFGFRQVPQGRYMIRAMARELGMAREMIGVRDGQVTRVRLELQGRHGGGGEQPDRETGSVVGQVINADGDAVANAVVVLIPQMRHRHGRGHHRPRGIRTRTNEEGIFEFEEVPVGNYIIGAWARGEGRARDRIEVLADQVTRIRLELHGR